MTKKRLTKKQREEKKLAALTQRVMDICNGAGMEWLTNDKYFEFHDNDMSCYGRMIMGCERVFGLQPVANSESRLRLPWRFNEMGDIDSLVELVAEAIKYDTEKD